MNRTHYLYLITRDDGEQYIGVTVDPARRFNQHKNGYGSPELSNRIFNIEILKQGNQTDIYNAEIEYIANIKPSLNKNKGGLGGFDIKGEEVWSSVLKEAQVISIVNEYNKGNITQNKLANKYKVSNHTIHRILNGLSWQYLNIQKGFNYHLTDEQVKQVKELYKEGLCYINIADKLNINIWAVKYHTKTLPDRKMLDTKVDKEIRDIIVSRRDSGLSWSKVVEGLNICSATARRHYNRYKNS